jgi:hypothetical protein
MDFIEIYCEVGETGSGSYQVVSFVISIVKFSDSATGCIDWWDSFSGA